MNNSFQNPDFTKNLEDPEAERIIRASLTDEDAIINFVTDAEMSQEDFAELMDEAIGE